MSNQPRPLDTGHSASLAQAYLYTKYRHNDGLTHEQAVAKLQEVVDRICARSLDKAD